MKFKVPWLLLSESGSFLHHLLSVIYENHAKECPLTKYEQFSNYCFGEIRSQRLVAPSST